MFKCKSLLLFLLVLVLVMSGNMVMAKDFPNKDIRMVTPSSPGGSSDTTLRLMAEYAKKYFDEDLVVVNRSGGGGTIALSALRNSKADGHTIMQAPVGLFTTKPHIRKADYTIDDFEYIIGLTGEPIMIGVLTSSPYKTLDDLIEAAKSNNLTYATSGVGTLLHLGMEQIALEAGVSFTHVPQGGGALTIKALLGNQVDFGLAHPAELKPQVEAGKVKVLAVLSKERLPKWPDVPTATEQGYNSVHAVWKLLMAPKGTPKEAIDYLHDKFKALYNDKEFKKKCKDLKINIVYRSPEEIEKELKRLYKDYGKVIDNLGLAK